MPIGLAFRESHEPLLAFYSRNHYGSSSYLLRATTFIRSAISIALVILTWQRRQEEARLLLSS